MAMSALTRSRSLPGFLAKLISLSGGQFDVTEAVTIDATALSSKVIIDANLLSRHFDITATSGDFALRGLELVNGRTTGGNPFFLDTDFNGGAIRSITSDELKLDQVVVRDSQTEGVQADGGGVFAVGNVLLVDSSIRDNRTLGFSAQAGGVLALGDITLDRSHITGNTAEGDNTEAGGLRSEGNVVLTDSSVTGNRTLGDNSDAGGLRALGDVTLLRSVVSGNSTSGERSDAGGMSIGGDLTMSSSTLAGQRHKWILLEGRRCVYFRERADRGQHY